jgi:uncharacterized RDD family membrane protein YckC
MLSDGMYGQSFGKIIMGIKAARLDGGVSNLAQTVMESVGKALSHSLVSNVPQKLIVLGSCLHC